MVTKDVINTILQEGIHFRLPKLKTRQVNIPTNTGKIITVIGPRRAGKTYVLFDAIKKLRKKVNNKKIIYINLEDERLLPINVQTLGRFLDVYQTLYPDIDLADTYWFFDEIQNVPQWEKFISRLYRYTQNIFITGSNSQLLSSEIATALRGRTLTFTVYPLTFAEFLTFKKVIKDPTQTTDLYTEIQQNPHIRFKVQNLFKEYSTFGGFPEITKYHGPGLKTKLLQEYFQGIFYKDLVERYNLTNTYLLRFFIKRFFENISKPFSVNKVYKQIKSAGYKVAKDTLYEYLDKIQAVFLTFSVKKYSKSELKLNFSPQKLYAIDWGLANAMIPAPREQQGALLENLVASTLIFQEKAIFYDANGYECDFIVFDSTLQQNPAFNKELLFTPTQIHSVIQVAQDISNDKTLAHEITGLAKATKKYNPENAYLLVDSDMSQLDSLQNKLLHIPSNTKIMPVWEFLLQIEIHN